MTHRSGLARRCGSALLAILLAGCVPDAAPRAAPGSPAPDYRAVTLEGDPFDLAEHRGEVVLLNIWATWCAPCRVEMPDLQRLHEEFRGAGLRVVGVSIDSEGARASVDRFLDELGIGFLIALDPADRVSATFGAYGVPLTVLIDRDGMVRWRHLGPVTSDDPTLRSALAAAL